METYSEVVKAVHAEDIRRMVAKMRGQNGGGTLTPSQAVKGATWRPNQWCYHTQINVRSSNINLYSYSDADKEVALRLYWAVQHTNPNSLTNKKKRKAEREAANADKRVRDLETYGDNSALEREVLTKTTEAMTSGGVISFIVLMLQTKADALFRTTDMPKDKYMREQHKTCSKIYVAKNGERSYRFGQVTGYAGCLVVFECKDDGAIFVAYGDDIDEGYKTRTSDSLNIIIGKYTDEPVLENKPWLHYLGKGPGVHAKLKQRLVDECGKDKLPLCTIAEANSELGGSNATEEAGIKLWIRERFGGIVPDDDPRWLELPQHWQDNKHIYMLTEKNRDVVAYPERVQQGKTDLLVYRKMLDYENPERWQHKSACPMSNTNGLCVGMTTNYGKINGKRQPGINTYKAGDNDFYLVTRVSEDKFHYWEFTDAEMVQHGYVGTGLTAFVVYTKDAPCACKTQHAWTVEKHYSVLV